MTQCVGPTHGRAVASAGGPQGRDFVGEDPREALHVQQLRQGDVLRASHPTNYHRRVRSLCLSVSQESALTAAQTLRLWNWSTGECERVFAGHTDAIQAFDMFGKVRTDHFTVSSTRSSSPLSVFFGLSGRFCSGPSAATRPEPLNCGNSTPETAAT
jgi:WD40 repeat protein